jgi:hypothetical protein
MTNLSLFPTSRVAEITHTTPDPERPNSILRWRDGTLDDLAELLEIGACESDDCQNCSPSIQQFLDNLESYSDRVSLLGYVVYPPRDDCRVSVEGFVAERLTAEEALDLMTRYGHADDRDCQKLGDTYSVRFWWD